MGNRKSFRNSTSIDAFEKGNSVERIEGIVYGRVFSCWWTVRVPILLPWIVNTMRVFCATRLFLNFHSLACLDRIIFLLFAKSWNFSRGISEMINVSADIVQQLGLIVHQILILLNTYDIWLWSYLTEVVYFMLIGNLAELKAWIIQIHIVIPETIGLL